MNNALTVTVYSKPGCFGCTKTIEKLEAAGIICNEVDITQNPDAFTYITQELGYSQAPVVVIEDGTGQDHWSGLRPDHITRITTQHSRENAVKRG